MDFSLPGSSVHGILQARILEWVAISSSWDLPDPEIEPATLNVYLHWQVGSLPLTPPGNHIWAQHLLLIIIIAFLYISVHLPNFWPWRKGLHFNLRALSIVPVGCSINIGSLDTLKKMNRELQPSYFLVISTIQNNSKFKRQWLGLCSVHARKTRDYLGLLWVSAQWLRLCAPNAGGAGSIPGQGTMILHQKKKKKKIRDYKFHPFDITLGKSRVWMEGEVTKKEGGTWFPDSWRVGLCHSNKCQFVTIFFFLFIW